MSKKVNVPQPAGGSLSESSVKSPTLETGSPDAEKTLSAVQATANHPTHSTEGAETMPVTAAIATVKPRPTVQRRVVTKNPTTADRNYVGNCKIDEIHWHLKKYLETGTLPDLHSPEDLTDMLDPKGGGNSVRTVVKGYFQLRALRRGYCDTLRQFIAAVEEDDSRRDLEEFPVLPLTKAEERQLEEERATRIIDHLVGFGTLASRTNDPQRIASGGIASEFFDITEAGGLLMPPVQSGTGAAAFGHAIFGPNLVPDPDSDARGSHVIDALDIARIFLEVSGKGYGSEEVLKAAAVAAERLFLENYREEDEDTKGTEPIED